METLNRNYAARPAADLQITICNKCFKERKKMKALNRFAMFFVLCLALPSCAEKRPLSWDRGVPSPSGRTGKTLNPAALYKMRIK